MSEVNPDQPKRRPGRPRKIDPGTIIAEAREIANSPTKLVPETMPPLLEETARRAITAIGLPQQHAVIQIKTGDYRGVLAQVGEIEGEVVHCYVLRPGGEKEHIQTKFGDFHLISQAQKGMVAWQYQKPIKENAPDWHQP